MVTVQKKISRSAMGKCRNEFYRGESAPLLSDKSYTRLETILECRVSLISIIRDENRLSFFPIFAKVPATRVQVITFAKLRFVVRQICDGFVPIARSNLLSGNSTLFSLSPAFSHFLAREALKNDWPARFTHLPSY